MAHSTQKNQRRHHHVAASAIFLCLLGLIAMALGSPHPKHVRAALLDTGTPTLTETTTATPTSTDIATATTTPTLDPCTLKPPAPKLRVPSDGAVIPATQLKIELRWKPVTCAESYRYKVYQDAIQGEPVSRKKGMYKTQITIKDLEPGHTYLWFAEACNTAGCIKSKARDFKISAPPQPTARPSTPVVPSTPAADPPQQIANYQGPSVYLDTTDPVYYFDCTYKWRPMGDIVLIIAVGFQPGENVSYRAYEISSNVTSATGNYIAAGNGWVATAINTSGWPGGHFHLIFTGRSSNNSECGHFDLDHGPARPLEIQDQPHP